MYVCNVRVGEYGGKLTQTQWEPLQFSLHQHLSLSSHTYPSIHIILLLLIKSPLYMVMSFTPERHQEGMIALSHTQNYIYIYICQKQTLRRAIIHVNSYNFTLSPNTFSPINLSQTHTQTTTRNPLTLMEICMPLTSVTCRCRGNTSCRGYRRPASVVLWDLVIIG